MSDTPKPPTHTAFALKREAKRRGRWLEIGTARAGADGAMHVFLDRLPVGGFNGYVYLAPLGASPPMPDEPQRPGHVNDEDGEP